MLSQHVPASNFNLKATLTSGQVFGFVENDRHFFGELRGNKVCLSQHQDALWFETSSRVNLAPLIHDYFDLARDLRPIYQILESDEALRPTMHFKGLRLIKQDSWEALACFIISSNNNVKRIQGIWKNLTARLGEKGSFPKPAAIARVHERVLRELGLGYRAPFLLRAAQFVSTNPETLHVIRSSPYEEAKKRLLAFPGIGEKVADCALLYGFQKFEAFPVDVWILRIVRKLYFKNRKVSEKRVRRFAEKKWAGNAGYVQQYLFHSARMGII